MHEEIVNISFFPLNMQTHYFFILKLQKKWNVEVSYFIITYNINSPDKGKIGMSFNF